MVWYESRCIFPCGGFCLGNDIPEPVRRLGREVLAVDDLATADGILHPVQPAFSDGLGSQCGFCTPEQIMSAVGLIRANPRPSREEARQAMSGNLCRCGAYDHYLNGVMRAAERNT